jgi:Spy/CpxP family protein refolding chaperone
MKFPICLIASSTLLSATLAVAQQPPATPAPPDGPAKARTIEPRAVRDVRVITGGDGPMTAGLRIGPPGMWWKNPDIVQKLSLTADQQKRMDDIFQQSRIQLIDLKANVEKQEVLLEPMLDANPPDTNKVLAQIDKVAQARADLEKANAKMLLGIRGVLSADQWTKLQADRRDGHNMIYRFKGPGHPGPMGPEGMLDMLPVPGFDITGPGEGGGITIMTQPPTE